MSDAEEIDVAALEKRMDGALHALRTEFASLRTGRASASMLDPVTVEAYGSPTPINQLGTITVPFLYTKAGYESVYVAFSNDILARIQDEAQAIIARAFAAAAK